MGTQQKNSFARACVEQAACAVLACVALVTLGGCAERKARAVPWTTAVLVHPNAPLAHGDGSTEAADIAPDFRVEPPPNNGKLFGTRPVPARPRVQASPQSETVNGGKTQMLVPELSPQETAAAQQQFAESAGIIEKNLALARKRKLTAMQNDMVSKVKGFMTEAREASGEGDWARARNLAKKAQILSEELVISF
jgi:hypothetical protein